MRLRSSKVEFALLIEPGGLNRGSVGRLQCRLWYTTGHYLHSCSLSLLDEGLSLLQDRKLDTVTLRKRNGRNITRADNEDVLLSRGEHVASGVSDSDNVEGARVLLDVDNNTHTTSVATLGDHCNVSRFELDVVDDLAGGDINLDGVINLDGRIRVSDSATVVGNNERDLLQGKLSALDLAELESLLLIRDSVKSVLALGVEDKSELIVGLGDLNDVHESSREVRISSDLSVNLDVLLNADNLSLATSQGVLQAVSQDENERQALSQLVRTLRWARSLHTKYIQQCDQSPQPCVLLLRCDILTQIPSILDSIQCLGALRRFKCFFGPRA